MPRPKKTTYGLIDWNAKTFTVYNTLDLLKDELTEAKNDGTDDLAVRFTLIEGGTEVAFSFITPAPALIIEGTAPVKRTRKPRGDEQTAVGKRGPGRPRKDDAQVFKTENGANEEAAA